MTTKRELTNLLPPDRKRAVWRLYFLRLVAVVCWVLVVLVTIHAAMLVPTYAYVREQVIARTVHLAQLSERLASDEEQGVSARLERLAEDADYLLENADAPSVSSALRTVLAVERTGVVLSGISYTPPEGEEAGEMVVRGTASTRDGLRAYRDALTALPGVSRADLPLGAFAEETDITFTITVTGSFNSSS